MYTIKNYLFGHNFSLDKKLNNEVWEYDLFYDEKINDKRFVIDLPYHGGQVRGDIYTVFCGIIITDDDQNDIFLDEIRISNREDYETDYNTFIDMVISDLYENKKYCSIDEIDNYSTFIENFIKFVKENKSDFYFAESSS